MTDKRIEFSRPPVVCIRAAQTHKYRKGETIVRAGSEVREWIAIVRGAACVETFVSARIKIAVAALWSGDVVGRGSPLGNGISSYEVTALADVETIVMPGVPPNEQESSKTLHLYSATATRLNRQIAARLAGNGPQRLICVLATLGEAYFQESSRLHRPHALGLPVAQIRLGQLAGLSRRQVWIYLGELARDGWIQTSRTRVILHGLSSWLSLRGEIEQRGLSCIATIDEAIETLSNLGPGRGSA